MDIRLIALDLDGTTLNSKKELTEENRSAIEEAIERGILTVVASGRTLNSLPENILDIKGLKYAATSNGAYITDLRTREPIYSNLVSPVAVDRIAEIMNKEKLWIEVFCRGQAHIEASLFEEITSGRILPERSDYVRTTRRPIEGIANFLGDNRDEIENVNFFFESPELKDGILKIISTIPDSTITNSMANNFEVIGKTTSKKNAVMFLADMFGIASRHVMAFGDAPNDIPMIEYAGFGVAMENSIGDTKERADYVCESCDDSGVGRTIRKFVL